MGLQINLRKTEVMRTVDAQRDEVTLDGERINEVDLSSN